MPRATSLEDYKVPQGEQVIDPRAAYMITNILSDPAAKLFTYGPNTPLMLHQNDDPKSPLWPSASKTGTTDNYRDTWTDGYTPDLAIVVWVGNADGHPMHQTLSTLTAAKVWPASMKMSFDYFGTCSRRSSRGRTAWSSARCAAIRACGQARRCAGTTSSSPRMRRAGHRAGWPAAATPDTSTTGAVAAQPDCRPADRRPRRTPAGRTPPAPAQPAAPAPTAQPRPTAAPAATPEPQAPTRRTQAARRPRAPRASGQAATAASRPSHRRRPEPPLVGLSEVGSPNFWSGCRFEREDVDIGPEGPPDRGDRSGRTVTTVRAPQRPARWLTPESLPR